VSREPKKTEPLDAKGKRACDCCCVLASLIEELLRINATVAKALGEVMRDCDP
jgi:hypothetical protein